VCCARCRSNKPDALNTLQAHHKPSHLQVASCPYICNRGRARVWADCAEAGPPATLLAPLVVVLSERLQRCTTSRVTISTGDTSSDVGDTMTIQNGRQLELCLCSTHRCLTTPDHHISGHHTTRVSTQPLLQLHITRPNNIVTMHSQRYNNAHIPFHNSPGRLCTADVHVVDQPHQNSEDAGSTPYYMPHVLACHATCCAVTAVPLQPTPCAALQAQLRQPQPGPDGD
jgi:hypothetical protein